MMRKRNRCYSPQLGRDTVRALYQEAKRRGQPMTRLADELISEALSRHRDHSTVLQETATTTSPNPASSETPMRSMRPNTTPSP
jgi:hypothetical protein